METYKLGNSVKAILRAYSPGAIGDVNIEYPMQPYTIINSAEANITFNAKDSNANNGQSLLNYNVDYVDSVVLSRVALTNKILNLIFTWDDNPLCTKTVNCKSNNEGIIYLPNEMMYQLFIYNESGELESVHDEVNSLNLQVFNSNSSYLLVYITIGKKGFFLNRSTSRYMSLDLEIEGNEENKTNKFWIHFEKCSLSVNKNLYFNGSVNSVDLKFKVIKSDNDYITIN